MSFKLNLELQQSFALSTHHIISVVGRDARVFLQAQLMNDVNALGIGHWQYTGLLNPQGRVLALFQLAEINSEHFLIILASLDPIWLIEHFKRFLFRSKVSIKLEQDYFAQGKCVASTSSNVVAQTMFGNDQEGYTIEIPDKNYTRKMYLSKTKIETDLQALDHWHCLDMALGWPWIDEKLQNLWTPQMLSLQELNAFSLKKGCYPGQEIVARTHFLGKSKRNFRLLSGFGLQNGQFLQQNSHEIGRIVNANTLGNIAVAVLPLELNSDLAIQNNVNDDTLLKTTILLGMYSLLNGLFLPRNVLIF